MEGRDGGRGTRQFRGSGFAGWPWGNCLTSLVSTAVSVTQAPCWDLPHGVRGRKGGDGLKCLEQP